MNLPVAVEVMRPLPALLAALRPRQWAKNALLLIALVFAQRASDPASVRAALLGVLSFCMLASAVYLGNDILDLERDRLHPEKRLRPIASGRLSIGLAAVTAVALCASALLLALFLPRTFLACALGYLALQIAYSTRLKHVVLLDVFAIAAGFVLRIVAGAEAIEVPVSNWLYICAMLLALFLALAKRRAELTLLGREAAQHRAILAEYSIQLTDQLLTIAASSAVLSYALYTVSAETVAKFGSDRLKLTLPFVLFGLFRYLYLVHRQGEGGKPERVLFHDFPMQINLLAYALVAGWAVYSRL
ncbi:MAG TPA: decaprenyl-phosphate phosphoribosyltransferase [Myxococcales bacterium]|nr:decaprenyl-phosphate phosphoribosyltransferase [Myxococcales bacterium]